LVFPRIFETWRAGGKEVWRKVKKIITIVLELSKGADAEEIKKAYRRLAKKYHPM
jgi:preprotein translocase subunit Sec63